MSKKELRKIFTRILGVSVGCRVRFIDFYNIPKYGTVVKSDRGLLVIHFYRKRTMYSAVRRESEVELQ